MESNILDDKEITCGDIVNLYGISLATAYRRIQAARDAYGIKERGITLKEYNAHFGIPAGLEGDDLKEISATEIAEKYGIKKGAATARVKKATEKLGIKDRKILYGEYKSFYRLKEVDSEHIVDNDKLLIVGIDPDIELCGLAAVDMRNKGNDRLFQVASITIPDIFKYAETMSSHIGKDKIMFIVEAGYLNKSTWHGVGASIGRNGKINKRDALRYAAEIGRKVGVNHGAAIVIVQVLKSMGMSVQEVKPSKKKGISGKITSDMFKQITGWKTTTNQDQRDAAMLLLKYIQ